MGNNRGVVHIFGMVILALLALLVFNSFRQGGALNTSAPVDPQMDLNSAEYIRQTSYAMIDLHGQAMKIQVDLALNTWDSMTPEQKQQIAQYVISMIKARTSQGQAMVEQIQKGQGE